MKSFLLSVTGALVAHAQQTTDPDPDQQAVFDALANAIADVPDVGTFAGAVQDNLSVLAPLVGDTDGFAVFAPNDAAFTALEAAIGKLPDDLTPVLSYHIVTDPVDFSSFPAVIETTLEADGLDTNQVLIVGENNTLSWGVGSASVVGDPVEFDSNQVFVIDGVLLPPDTPAAVLTNDDAAESSQPLADALDAADLVNTVNDASNITVFAPVAAAWDGVDLDSFSQEDLQNLLQYHVIPQVVYSPDIGDGGEFETLNGKTLNVSVDGDTVNVNSAAVVATDYLTNNGVIHYIDAILDVADGQDPDGDERTSTDNGTNAAGSLKAVGGVVGVVMAGLALML